jgi:hypothetical protein
MWDPTVTRRRNVGKRRSQSGALERRLGNIQLQVICLAGRVPPGRRDLLLDQFFFAAVALKSPARTMTSRSGERCLRIAAFTSATVSLATCLV